MKVLLVRTFRNRKKFVSLGLAYLAAVLEKDGHAVRISDVTYSDDYRDEQWKPRLRQTVLEFKPDLIGFSFTSHERFVTHSACNFIKTFYNAPVMLGGPHATFLDVETLRRVPSVDIVVRHEGEETVKELCALLGHGKDISCVKGITFRKTGRIISNEDRPFIQDIDLIPFPARHHFDIYEQAVEITTPQAGRANLTYIMSSRGCPFHCAFCSIAVQWGNRIRFRSARNFAGEMESVVAAYPKLDGFFISDDDFTCDPQRTVEVCREIKKRKLDIVWKCYGKVSSITAPLLEEMHSAGCRVIRFGMESFSDRILHDIKKGTTAKQIEEAVRLCKKHRIQPEGAFILHHPRETMAELRNTLSFIERNLSARGQFAIASGYRLYPGTSLTREYLRNFDWFKEVAGPHDGTVPVRLPENYEYRRRVVRRFWRRRHIEYAFERVKGVITRPIRLYKEYGAIFTIDRVVTAVKYFKGINELRGLIERKRDCRNPCWKFLVFLKDSSWRCYKTATVSILRTIAFCNHFKNDRILRRLINGQKVLIVASGPSAAELDGIPGDVKVFTCNASLRLFDNEKFGNRISLFLAHQRSFEQMGVIDTILPRMKIDLFIMDNLSYLKKKNDIHGVYAGLIYDNGPNNYYLERLIRPYTVRQIKGGAYHGWTSSGMRLLQYALYFGAKEVYMAGIDFGRGGYFWGQDNRWLHNHIDENFVKIIAGKYDNVYSASKNSPLTKYLKYRPLK